jgi:hypothetical protein
MTTTTIASLEAYIADKLRQIESLEARYGTGVRPAWVGEEIGMIDFYIRDAQAAIKELEAE